MPTRRTDRRSIVDYGDAALTAAIQHDVTLVDDPARLGRALSDASPFDDNLRHAAVLGASLGIPGMISAGRVDDAVTRLRTRGGQRLDVALWTISLWCEALSIELPPHLGEMLPLDLERVPPPSRGSPSMGRLPPREDPDGDPPGALPASTTYVRACKLDDAVIVVVGTQSGLFAATGVEACARPSEWVNVAAPTSPLSRDLSLVSEGAAKVTAVWSSENGLEQCAIRPAPGTGQAEAGPSVGDPSRLFQLAGAEPRYPLVASLADEKGIVDLTWTADRRELRRTTVDRQGSTSEPVALPAAVATGERLIGLASTPASPTTTWLVALTDRARVLLLSWDTSVDQYGSWVSAAAPVSNVVAIAIADVTGVGPVLFTATADRRLLCLELAPTLSEAWPWRSFGLPEGLPPGTQCTSIAAIPDEDGSTLLLVCAGAIWRVPVTINEDRASCGEARLFDQAPSP